MIENRMIEINGHEILTMTPSRRTIAFKKGVEYSPHEAEYLAVSLPYCNFYVFDDQLFLFHTLEEPNADSKVYSPHFPNVDEYGEVCMINYYGPSNDLERAVDYFWNSSFNEDTPYDKKFFKKLLKSSVDDVMQKSFWKGRRMKISDCKLNVKTFFEEL